MVRKNFNETISYDDYLAFLQQYSSELKFMSPWTQIDNTEQINSSKISDSSKETSGYQRKTNNSIVLSQSIAINELEKVSPVKH